MIIDMTKANVLRLRKILPYFPPFLSPSLSPSTSRDLEREVEAEMSQPTIEPDDSISVVGQPPSRFNGAKEEDGYDADVDADADAGVDADADADDDQLLPDVPGVAGAVVKRENSLSQVSGRSSDIVECDPPLLLADKNYQYTTKKHCP